MVVESDSYELIFSLSYGGLDLSKFEDFVAEIRLLTEVASVVSFYWCLCLTNGVAHQLANVIVFSSSWVDCFVPLSLQP